MNYPTLTLKYRPPLKSSLGMHRNYRPKVDCFSHLYPFVTLVRVFWRETTNFGSKTSASLDFNAYKLGQTYNFIVLGSHIPIL